MSEIKNTTHCERANDLVSFLYGEANEKEAREFKQHLHECAACESEVASFVQVRESIGVWKDEALGVFVSAEAIRPVQKQSAVAALREFFNLSPLWIKGAVAFATVVFCALVVLTIYRSSTPNTPAQVAATARYTQVQVDEIVKNALDTQAATVAAKTPDERETSVVVSRSIKNRTSNKNNGASQTAKGRRSLSKAEREQLAADLRLFSTSEESNLNLLGDKINQEFQR
jgi:anti-sigma factor RsiW